MMVKSISRAGNPSKLESAKVSPWEAISSIWSHVTQKPPRGSVESSGAGWASSPQELKKWKYASGQFDPSYASTAIQWPQLSSPRATLRPCFLSKLRVPN